MSTSDGVGFSCDVTQNESEKLADHQVVSDLVLGPEEGVIPRVHSLQVSPPEDVFFLDRSLEVETGLGKHEEVGAGCREGAGIDGGRVEDPADDLSSPKFEAFELLSDLRLKGIPAAFIHAAFGKAAPGVEIDPVRVEGEGHASFADRLESLRRISVQSKVTFFLKPGIQIDFLVDLTEAVVGEQVEAGHPSGQPAVGVDEAA